MPCTTGDLAILSFGVAKCRGRIPVPTATRNGTVVRPARPGIVCRIRESRTEPEPSGSAAEHAQDRPSPRPSGSGMLGCRTDADDRQAPTLGVRVRLPGAGDPKAKIPPLNGSERVSDVQGSRIGI